MKYRVKVQLDECQTGQIKYIPQYKWFFWWFGCCDAFGTIFEFNSLEKAKDCCIKHKNIKTNLTYIYLDDV